MLPTQKTEKATSAPQTETKENLQNEQILNEAEQITESDNLPAVVKPAEIANLNETDAVFDAMEQSEGMEISSDYLKLLENETKDFICAGIEQSEFERKDNVMEMRDVAILYDKDKKRFIAAQTTLVGTIKAYCEKNPNKQFFPIRITCTGKKEISGGGYYFTFKVMVF